MQIMFIIQFSNIIESLRISHVDMNFDELWHCELDTTQVNGYSISSYMCMRVKEWES